MRHLLDRIYADASRDESRRLADAVQRSLVQTLRKIEPALTNRGVKTAPFVVLVATEMPAILAEVSCLSNADEAERPEHAGVPTDHRRGAGGGYPDVCQSEHT